VPDIELRTVIAASAEACFDLSLSVDAHTRSLGRSGERAVAGVTSGVLGGGDCVTWEAHHFGVPFRMTVMVTEYARPWRFVDEQQRGPFRDWWHEHTFEERDGLVLMTDRVRFSSPLWVLGRAVDRLVLTGYMTRLLRTRNASLRAELERRR
jgi:ligand-binding SRPBCC domain-containing protein